MLQTTKKKASCCTGSGACDACLKLVNDVTSRVADCGYTIGGFVQVWLNREEGEGEEKKRNCWSRNLAGALKKINVSGKV